MDNTPFHITQSIYITDTVGIRASWLVLVVEEFLSQRLLPSLRIVIPLLHRTFCNNRQYQPTKQYGVYSCHCLLSKKLRILPLFHFVPIIAVVLFVRIITAAAAAAAQGPTTLSDCKFIRNNNKAHGNINMSSNSSSSSSSNHSVNSIVVLSHSNKRNEEEFFNCSEFPPLQSIEINTTQIQTCPTSKQTVNKTKNTTTITPLRHIFVDTNLNKENQSSTSKDKGMTTPSTVNSCTDTNVTANTHNTSWSSTGNNNKANPISTSESCTSYCGITANEKKKKAEEKIKSLLALYSTINDINSTSTNTATNGTTNNFARKRQDYITWDDYFMAVAKLSSYRSKDPVQPTGTCIVDDYNRIIGIGYNGFPNRCNDDFLPWASSNEDKNSNACEKEWLHTPAPYVCHAEVNAILNKCTTDVAGARMYMPYFPGNECAKVIVQSRIKEIIYMHNKTMDSNNDEHANDYDDDEVYLASYIMFTLAGVKMTQYKPSMKSIDLTFHYSNATAATETTDHDDDDREKGKDDNGIPSWGEFQKIRNLLLHEANQYDILEQEPWNMKRKGNSALPLLSWDDYFMSVAFLAARRSKDPNTQVGACIVDRVTKRIMGVGYNGFPIGCNDDILPWNRCSTFSGKLHTKYMFVVHAEVNAILNRCSASLGDNTTMYVALFPCNECAKMIIQSGITEVVYVNDPYHNTESCKASRILLEMADVKYRQYVPPRPTLRIKF